MPRRILLPIQALLLLFSTLAGAAEPYRVESFAPQGTVKGVRQATARFSAPMIPFGDPHLPEPFLIDCPVKGTGRWADARNWAYDFDRDLQAGIACTFKLKPGLQALDGTPAEGATEFTFSTGGPAVVRSVPEEGSSIEERQIFILGLDAPADKDSIRQHAWCSAQGINEKIGVRLVEGRAREQILSANRDFLGGTLTLLFKSRDQTAVATLAVPEKGTPFEQAVKAHADQIVVLQCVRRLPAKSQVSLVWDAGIASVSGVATGEKQALAYQVRENFQARFNCERANKDANCIPILPLTLSFSAPLPTPFAKRIRLAGEGKIWRPVLAKDESGAVYSVSFAGPFPERASLTLSLPDGISDDSGRPLHNRKRFPLTVKTDAAPPLAKFPADFGIIEHHAGALLPVTVRNLEAELDLAKTAAEDGVPGKMQKAGQSPKDILHWLKRMKANANDEWGYDNETGRSVLKTRSGDHSIFDANHRPTHFKLPKPNGAKAFEVIGIPLEKPGLYVVELVSPKLGAALLGDKTPYYARTSALVTNLSVHFKQGRESSLAWVTSLDKGEPVAGAEVEVRDCDGKRYWQGKTGQDGLARIEKALPGRDALPVCFDYQRSYFVAARLSDDLGFVFSHWNEGIDRWRFNLPGPDYQGPILAITVFDRTLLRAGETVHMKHFYRRHTRQGFALEGHPKLPSGLVIQHVGSDQTYQLPLKWDPDGSAESTWPVPKDAKQGTYQVSLSEPAAGRRQGIRRNSGSFRVEAFRVPTMKAILKPLGTPLVNAGQAELDIQLNYLSGGGAGGLPVKLRGLVEPRAASFPDYAEFTFANGGVKEGLQSEPDASWRNGDYEASDGEDETPAKAAPSGSRPLAVKSLVLDAVGAARATLDKLPRSEAAQNVTAELEYRDPNGETLTASSRFTLWPSKVVLGLKPDSWAVSKDHLKFQVLALDLSGKPQAGVAVTVDLLQQRNLSHRKRLIGGFYAFEHKREIKRLGETCTGTTDAKGLLHCDASSAASGNLILRARAADDAGNPSWAHQNVWVAGKDEWWFGVSNNDRMDVLPEKKRYEPGDTATFQVRMPFRSATALVTVEREGVIDSFVQQLSGKEPVITLPIKPGYAPNVFVSVLAVRGRVNDVQPTALVDLGKPAFKLGIGQINVGWRAHELKVAVSADRAEYPVRGTARVRLKVARADGGALPAGAEVALAAVDEGLLELMPNDSWKLLDAMMKTRGLEVDTATAQMQVVGKRHFGRKAVAHGGGGGRQTARELFETLLKWQGEVKLDANGEASVDIPLNDSLSAFRIVAVANAGAGLFGTGATTVRTGQDVILLSGLPPLVREQDAFRAVFTLRNASKQALALHVEARLGQSRGGAAPRAEKTVLPPREVELAPGEAREIAWDVSVPLDADRLHWEVSAKSKDGKIGDSIKVTQKVVPAVPVRTFQATLMQLDQPLALAVAKPADALPGRGGVVLHLKNSLAGELAGVREYMAAYPYTCLEQRVSQAVALRDEGQWKHVMASLPAYLDSDGLVKYFPLMQQGSDILTAYLLAVADEAGWSIPEAAKSKMTGGLNGFVEGRVRRYSALPTADLAIRKVAALEALSRHGAITDAQTQSFSIEPNLWPTSAVLDWYSLLNRAGGLSNRDQRIKEAENIIRSRLNFQGTVMGFSTERSDYLWWLMVSGDVNANRAILDLLGNPAWKEDMPRLVRGTLGRQHKGRWNTTVANAWGVLALEKFARAFEAIPVAGKTGATLTGQHNQELDWARKTQGGDLAFGWPKVQETLNVAHAGAGKPWLTLESRAAIPLKQPFSSGFKATKTVTAVEQKTKGGWSRGDVLRVRLDLEAQSDMGWVVVDDPIPAGATVLGTGLGRDSRILAQGEKKRGWVWPAFEERTFEAFRAYYAFVPKGKWSVEYTLRLNNSGRFELPATRVEAMYSPEMFGEVPNNGVVVGQ